ncbi:MAG: PAS domain-containing protein, partial [Alphaproteobacteria bacterium]|nr:PAS domain-containing protein [Alphaproteobacteria bacterium]
MPFANVNRFKALEEALDKSQAIISFKPDGTIINANKNFLSAMGYSLDEIKGKHHRMFVDQAYGTSQEYTDFWKSLGEGQFKSAEFKR